MCKAALYCSLGLFFYSLLVYGWFVDWQHNAFVLIEKIRMFPPFPDMRWITATSECGVDLPDLVSGRAFGCDPYGRGGIGYPPMSIQLARLLGVTGSHTGLIGLSTGMALVVLLLVQLRQMVPIPWQRDLAGAVILIGFPVELALERANVDIVLFLLMASLAAALASKRVYLLPICLGLAFVLVAGKIYPFSACVPGWLWRCLDDPRLSLQRLQFCSGLFLALRLSFLGILPTQGAYPIRIILLLAMAFCYSAV